MTAVHQLLPDAVLHDAATDQAFFWRACCTGGVWRARSSPGTSTQIWSWTSIRSIELGDGS
jgi:hypothetical protein